MAIICQCRGIQEAQIQSAFDAVKEKKPDNEGVAVDDLQTHFGDFVCGGCARHFERAADQHNKTGTVDLLARRRERLARQAAEKGAAESVASIRPSPDTRQDQQGKPCAFAQTRRYSGDPKDMDLSRPPIWGLFPAAAAE